MAKAVKTPGSVLKSMMDEYQLNPLSLSRELKISQSAVRQVVIGKTKISVPVAMRLAKFFGTVPAFWLDIQKEYDLAEAAKDEELTATLAEITKAKKPAASKEPAAGKRAGGKKDTLADKRKDTAKTPGAKSPRGRKPKAPPAE